MRKTSSKLHEVYLSSTSSVEKIREYAKEAKDMGLNTVYVDWMVFRRIRSLFGSLDENKIAINGITFEKK